jgi:RimJ/RimL family protein N-acetyltransferase
MHLESFKVAGSFLRSGVSLPPSPSIRLRPIEPADLPALFEFQLDPESNRMAVANPRDREAFQSHWDRNLGNPHNTSRAILADDQLAGSISCFPMDGLPSVGYWIARPHWNRGIATRAIALLLAEVPTRPLHATAAESNLASIRALQRNGFQITGSRFAPATDRFPACTETLLTLP